MVASRRADLQAARNDSLLTVAQAFFDLQAARGRLLGVGATIARAELLVNFTTALAPSLIAPLEINRAQTELQSLRQTQQVAIRDWRVASAGWRKSSCSTRPRCSSRSSRRSCRSLSSRAEQSAEELCRSPSTTVPRSPRGDELSPRPSSSCGRRRTRPLLPNLVIIEPGDDHGVARRPATSPRARTGRWAQRRPDRHRGRRRLAVAERRVGNIGRIRQRRAEQEVASVELTRIVFRVKSEVSQAVARLQTARVRVVETEEGVRQAIESADKNFIGLRETTRPAGELLRLIVRPQEVVAGDRSR